MLKILVVDDSRSVHAFVTACLAKTKCQMTHVFDGLEALETLKTNTDFGLILLDWEMPRCTGPELVVEMKKSSLSIPVVMMTTRNSPEDLMHMASIGVGEYVMKPFTTAILLEKLELVIGQLVKNES